MRGVRVAVRGAALAAHLLLAAAKLRWGTVDEGFMLWWNRAACRILGLRVRRTGAVTPAPAMIVSNHISWLEVIAFGSVLPASFVAKSEVASWPGIGRLAACAGALFLRRGSSRAASRSVTEAATRLASGRSVVFFPEGTSTDGSSVLPFHAALFEAAARVGCEVQPVTVSYPRPRGRPAVAPFIGDDEFLPHLLRVLAEPETTVRLAFHEPIDAHGRERGELRDLAREAVVEGLLLHEERRAAMVLIERLAA